MSTAAESQKERKLDLPKVIRELRRLLEINRELSPHRNRCALRITPGRAPGIAESAAGEAVKPFIKSPASEIIDPVEFAVTYPRFALFPAVRPWHPYRAGDGFDCVRFLNAC